MQSMKWFNQVRLWPLTYATVFTWHVLHYSCDMCYIIHVSCATFFVWEVIYFYVTFLLCNQNYIVDMVYVISTTFYWQPVHNVCNKCYILYVISSTLLVLQRYLDEAILISYLQFSQDFYSKCSEWGVNAIRTTPIPGP